MSSYFTTADVVTPNSFLAFPKELLSDKYSHISLDAKVLYSILLDRVSLSIKNNFVDENGNVYIISKQKEIMDLLGFASQKVQKLFKELEQNDLIDRKKQGNNLPDLIFVKKLVAAETVTSTSVSESTSENHHSGQVNFNTPGEVNFTTLNKTNINYTKINDTESINHNINKPVQDSCNHETKQGLIDFANAREFVCNQISEYAISEDLSYSDSKMSLNSIISLMTEVYTRKNGKITVNGGTMSYEELRNRLMELNQFHVEYVLECLSERPADAAPIKNVKAYLATALYNAPVTMETYYAEKTKRLLTENASRTKTKSTDSFDLDALAW